MSDKTFARKVISPGEREARKAFRQVDAEKAVTEHEIAERHFMTTAIGSGPSGWRGRPQSIRRTANNSSLRVLWGHLARGLHVRCSINWTSLLNLGTSNGGNDAEGKLSPEGEVIAAYGAAMVAAFQVLINCLEESDAILPGQFPEALRVYMFACDEQLPDCCSWRMARAEVDELTAQNFDFPRQRLIVHADSGA